MNPRRRVLLIAMASWGLIALRAKSANPVTGAFGLFRLVSSIFGGAAKLAIPIAKTPLKVAWASIRYIWRGLRKK